MLKLSIETCYGKDKEIVGKRLLGKDKEIIGKTKKWLGKYK